MIPKLSKHKRLITLTREDGSQEHTYVPQKRYTAKLKEIYSKEAEKFKDGKICANCINRAHDVHHKKGRVGNFLLDMRTWIAVCRDCHIMIEMNPNWARENGYIETRI